MILPALIALTVLAAQDAPIRPTFEVASVRENTTNGPADFKPRRSGDRVIMHNTRLDFLINFAYGIDANHRRAEGDYLRLPAFMDWFDVEAKSEGVVDDDKLRLMFQGLLEDRFHMKAHWEAREWAAYDLVVAKPGKLKESQPDAKLVIDGRAMGTGRSGIAYFTDGPHLFGIGVSMEQLVQSISSQLNAPVHDTTGLTGTFDYNLVFARDGAPPDATTAPDFQAALQQELGLKLVKGKGQVQVLVIEHIEKPTAN